MKSVEIALMHVLQCLKYPTDYLQAYIAKITFYQGD